MYIHDKTYKFFEVDSKKYMLNLRIKATKKQEIIFDLYELAELKDEKEAIEEEKRYYRVVFHNEKFYRASFVISEGQISQVKRNVTYKENSHEIKNEKIKKEVKQIAENIEILSKEGYFGQLDPIFKENETNKNEIQKILLIEDERFNMYTEKEIISFYYLANNEVQTTKILKSTKKLYKTSLFYIKEEVAEEELIKAALTDHKWRIRAIYLGLTKKDAEI